MLYAVITLLFILLIIIMLFARRSGGGEEFTSTMSEKDLEDNVKRLAISLRSGEPVGSIPNVDTHLRAVKRAYKVVVNKANNGLALHECEKWLYENYYSVTIDLKQSDYKGFSKLTHKKNGVRIIQLARFLVAASNCNLTQDTVRRVVELFNDYTPLHYEETLNLERAIAYALIERVAKIGKEIVRTEKLRVQAENDLEPVKRLCKYDAYLYFFKHSGKYLDEKYFYKINDINPDNIDVSFANNLVDMSVLISNCISSMKRLKDMFSDEFKIELCSTYSIMAQDEVYKNMDMCSKFAYLSAVSKLSALYGASERSIAKSAMELAKIHNVHFGEIIYDYRYAIKAHIHSLTLPILKKPTTKADQRLYAIVIALVCAVFTGLSVIFLGSWQMRLAVGLIMPFAAVPTTKFAVSLIVDRLLPARNVAAMNYIDLPEEARTLVVKNEFLTNAEQARDACRSLIALAKSNRDAMLEYALLVDLKASATETEGNDDTVLNELRSLSEYKNINVFVRKRKYIDGKWQAYERKRGATNALNNALLSGDYNEFSFVLRGQSRPEFVVLLDDDNTVMPGGIKRAVNTMLHPLNAKYTLMTFRSRYKLSSLDTYWAKNYKSDSGVDSYCNYGDFYYKISGHSIYCGKGIYRLSEYVRQMEGQLPDNRILSHDIIEGAIVPTGSLALPTYEDAPKNFVSHNLRQNRWERGDLLLIPYIFSKKVSQPFYRYVIAYNALKTLVPALWLSLLVTLAASGNAFLLIPVSLGILATWLIRFGLCLNDLGYDKRARYVFKNFIIQLINMVYELIMLPYFATSGLLLWLKMGFKCIFDRKKLLEWKTFYSSQRQNGYSKHISILLPSYILSVALAAVFYTNIYILVYIASYFVLSNVIYLCGRKIKGRKEIEVEDKEFLLDLANKTAAYFESNLKDNSLICDNYQVFPQKHANGFTSPTNMGFALLSYLCSYKIGRIDLDECMRGIFEHIELAESLEKYEGHLFNWYSLATRKPLHPYFVSSVDSGNYIAALITVKEFVKDIDVKLYARINDLVDAVDFDALFDRSKGKFHIGYNKAEGKFEGHYDMLASESRTLCYIASAVGGDTCYWDGLGRNIAKINGNTLISWSGTAFEYLMPQIFLQDCDGSLLTSSVRNIIKIMQKAKCGGVWGISESCYYEFNDENSYKYSAFGVSSISLSAQKDRCVVSPYSSALALRYAPKKVVRNLRNLAEEGLITPKGMFEAIDFTNGKNIVATLMSHHQGMILCSIVNALYDDFLIKLFMSDSAMDGGRLMLEEQIPENKSKSTKKFDFVYGGGNTNNYLACGECGAFPKASVLTNGHYSCVIDSSGKGYSYAKGKYLSKPALDHKEKKGGFFYICDGKELYSPTYEPFCTDKCSYTFKPYESEFKNVDRDCSMSVYIPQNFNCEIRKITIVNREGRSKLYKCGYCEEVALTDFGSTFSHPAFNDMFVSTSIDDKTNSLIAKRTSRNYYGDCFTALCVLGVDKMEYESNLTNFVGREGSFAAPNIFGERKVYGKSSGDVLNPCLGFIGEIEVAANSSKELYCVKFYDSDIVSLKNNLEQCKMLDFAKYSYESARLTMLSKTYKYQLNENISDLVSRIATNILYRPYDRDKLSSIAGNRQERLPIGLDKGVKYIYFEHYGHDEALKNMIYATIYLNMTSVKYVLVVGYKADGNNNEYTLKSFVDMTNIGDILQLDCVKFLRLNGIDDGALKIIRDNAFIELATAPKKGEKAQFDKESIAYPSIKETEKTSPISAIYGKRDGDIRWECGAGGFDEKGDYIVTETPLLPYSNVICADKGGFVVTQNGGGFDYFENSNLFRVTRFENNPVFDTPCEELYVEIGGFRRVNRLCEGGYVKHTQGASEFCASIDGIDVDVKESVIKNGDIKVIALNMSKSKGNIDTRVLFRLNAMLNDLPINQMLFDEQIDKNTMRITNALNGKSVYIRMSTDAQCIHDSACLRYSDGCVNIGEGSSDFHNPSHAALSDRMSGKRIQVKILISQSYESLSGVNLDSIDAMIIEQENKFKDMNKFELCSNNKNLDIIFNKWLAYQVVSSRINGKCGYYQAGGAIGFRDQLQDMLTMLYIDPEKVKNHILLSAEHQFLEGDVQHWWHGDCFGVRTHITDDRLFLAYLTFEYINFTGDKMILNSVQRYLTAPPLDDGVEGRLESPEKSRIGESLLSHIKRAIDETLKYGSNGLLLIGGGDWNDALNEIGIRRKGESVWLSMFAVHVLRNFIKYIDFDQRQKYLAHIENLQLALEKAFKDGYFMRAVTDNGEELGVKNCPHFEKDILCQSWSAIANISSRQRQRQALRSVADLVDGERGLIKLLWPPQSKEHYYGYISSYPKGVRENGGQYTHAAAWYIKALAMLDEKVPVGECELSAGQLLDLINPITKNLTAEGSKVYKGEPYVFAGDVYSNADNYGRMGWSWYTGSASILYDTIIRDLFGITLSEGKMSFARPKIDGWEDMRLSYRYKGTVYMIEFAQGAEDCMRCDGIAYKGNTALALKENEGRKHIQLTFR